MRTVREAMETAQVVSPDTTVQELNDLLSNARLDGACVVESGHLIGVVTAMDLIYQDKQLHLPSYFIFMEAVIPLFSAQQALDELRRMSAQRVRDIMTREVFTVGPDTSVADTATAMVDRHLSMVPVVEKGALLGVVTRTSMLRAMSRSVLKPSGA